MVSTIHNLSLSSDIFSSSQGTKYYSCGPKGYNTTSENRGTTWTKPEKDFLYVNGGTGKEQKNARLECEKSSTRAKETREPRETQGDSSQFNKPYLVDNEQVVACTPVKSEQDEQTNTPRVAEHAPQPIVNAPFLRGPCLQEQNGRSRWPLRTSAWPHQGEMRYDRTE